MLGTLRGRGATELACLVIPTGSVKLMTETDPQPDSRRWLDAVRRAKEAGLLENIVTRRVEPPTDDEDAVAVMRLADHVRDYVLRAEDTSTPYLKLWSESPHPVPSELNDDELVILIHIAAEADDWRLCVRCLDVLAIRETGVARVNRVVEMLVTLRDSLASGALKESDFRTIDRAFAVAGYGSSVREVLADIEAILVQRAMTSGNQLEHLWVSQHLRENKRAREHALEIAESFDRRFQERGERLDGEEAAEWFLLAGDTASAHARLLNVVLGLQRDAEAILAEQDPMTALTAAHLSEVALKMLSRVPVKVRNASGQGALLDQLVALPRIAGKILLSLATSHKTPQPDLQGIREALCGNISEADPNTAVSLFLHLMPLADVALLRAAAEQSVKEHGVLRRFPRAHLERDGRTSAASDPANDPDVLGVPATVWQQMMKTYRLMVTSAVEQVLLPAWAELRNRHALTLTDFIQMAKLSGLIPPGRERMVGRALYYGFHGDFLSAAQLLAPQVENLLRYHLANANERTSRIENSVEHENGLSTLVESHKMDAVFGADEAFEIRALFSGNGGVNLRNTSAHGQLADHDYRSPFPFHAWWLVWKLIATEFGNTERDATASANREPADPPEPGVS